MIGLSGVVDYVEFWGEYGPWDMYDLDNFARATELHGISSMMKVDQDPKCFIAQRALKSGIQNILFTDTRSVKDAEECVRIVKPETPEHKGLNGCHAARSAGYGLEAGSADYVKAMNEVVIVLMIEKKGAVDNIEGVTTVKGVDMVQFGPCDYRLSVGLAGKRSEEGPIREAEREVISAALRNGVRPRVELQVWTTRKDIEYYTELGVRDFSFPNELRILHHYLKEHGKELQDILTRS